MSIPENFEPFAQDFLSLSLLDEARELVAVNDFRNRSNALIAAALSSDDPRFVKSFLCILQAPEFFDYEVCGRIMAYVRRFFVHSMDPHRTDVNPPTPLFGDHYESDFWRDSYENSMMPWQHSTPTPKLICPEMEDHFLCARDAGRTIVVDQSLPQTRWIYQNSGIHQSVNALMNCATGEVYLPSQPLRLCLNEAIDQGRTEIDSYELVHRVGLDDMWLHFGRVVYPRHSLISRINELHDIRDDLLGELPPS